DARGALRRRSREHRDFEYASLIVRAGRPKSARFPHRHEIDAIPDRNPMLGPVRHPQVAIPRIRYAQTQRVLPTRDHTDATKHLSLAGRLPLGVTRGDLRLRLSRLQWRMHGYERPNGGGNLIIEIGAEPVEAGLQGGMHPIARGDTHIVDPSILKNGEH